MIFSHVFHRCCTNCKYKWTSRGRAPRPPAMEGRPSSRQPASSSFMPGIGKSPILLSRCLSPPLFLALPWGSFLWCSIVSLWQRGRRAGEKRFEGGDPWWCCASVRTVSQAPPRLHLLPQTKVSPPLYSFSLHILQFGCPWSYPQYVLTLHCAQFGAFMHVYLFCSRVFFCKSAYGDLLVNFALFCVVAWLGYVHLGR
jgi:hypothetical protein